MCPVWGRCKQNGKQEVVHRAAALRALVPLWWLFGSNVPRKGGVDESRPQDSGLHIVPRLGPRTSLVLLFAGKTWFHLTRHGRTCSCPPVSRLSVPVFLHFHLSSRDPLLVSKRIARATSLPASRPPRLLPIQKITTLRRRLVATPNHGLLLSRLSPTSPSDTYSRTPPFGNAAIAFIFLY